MEVIAPSERVIRLRRGEDVEGTFTSIPFITPAKRDRLHQYSRCS